MTKEELVKELHVHISDLKDTIEQSNVVRSSVERDLLTENEAIDDQVTLVYSLIQKSETMSSLIDNFLDSSPSDHDLVDRASQLVSEAKVEIARFQENKIFDELGDIKDETKAIQ